MGTEQFLVTDATNRIGSWANSRVVKLASPTWAQTQPKAKCIQIDGFALRTSHTTIHGTSYLPKLVSHNQQQETKQASSMLPQSSPINYSWYKCRNALYNSYLSAQGSSNNRTQTALLEHQNHMVAETIACTIGKTIAHQLVSRSQSLRLWQLGNTNRELANA